MDKKDMKQIEEVLDKSFEKNFDKSFNKAFTSIWEGNLQPAFDGVNEGLDILQTKLDKALYHEFDRLEKRVKLVEEKLGIKQV